MKEPFISVKKKLKFFSTANQPYKELRKHLDKQPVGYPATPSGVELRLLKEIFTTAEAKAALHLSYKLEPFEAIYNRAKDKKYERQEFKHLIESMEKKGCIFVKRKDRETYYALHPFVIGFFEMQLKRLTPSLYLDAHKYALQAYGMEYLTSHVPQLRVIPIDKSLTLTQNVATYDQIKEIVDRTKDRITAQDCICKVGKDLIGDPCKVTDRREVCMGFRDFADTYARHGWGRTISKKEAMDILEQNEKDGLVLMTASMQEPQFLCSCCDCCCGIIETIKIMPRPVDFAASNFYAELNPDLCNGCQTCVKRCQMEAIQFNEKAQKAIGINDKRCIGCGLCVSTCKTGSIKLKKKDTEFVPPEDFDELYEVIMQNKKGMGGKIAKMGKAILGVKV
jgi:NAD-dependent dihydropyrimidine dehydrogenase PreA subunit